LRGGGSRCHAQRLTDKTPLAEEIADIQNGEDCFLALLGPNPQLDFALRDVKDGIRRISLREDDLPPAQLGPGFAGLDSGQEQRWIERRLCFGRHRNVSPKCSGSA
jgi:hypothetical protein